jgi:adenylate kinase
MNRLIIIPFGPPGVGKGTQAKLISQRLGIPHISSGDLFRDNIKGGTELGKAAKSIIAEGKLVGDEIVMGMVFKRFEEKDCGRGFILDGVPRTITQAELFRDHLTGDDELIVVNFTASEKEVTRRICGRLVCKDCHAAFHKEFHPPKKEGICDLCGGELFRRSDDTEEVVKERLSLYKKETAPLTKFYKDLLITIDCSGSVDEIQVALLKQVGQHLPKSLGLV